MEGWRLLVDRVAIFLSWSEDVRKILCERDSMSKLNKLRYKEAELRYISGEEPSYAVFLIETAYGRRLTGGVLGVTCGEPLVFGCKLDNLLDTVYFVSKSMNIPVLEF